jgi:hypothetical protein
MRQCTLVFGAIISSTLLIGTANAVPITPGTITLLSPGSDYTAAPTAADVGSGFFSVDYLFDVPANVTTTVFASSHQPFPGAGEPSIVNLTLSWLDSAGNALPGFSSVKVTDASGQTVAGTLMLALLAGGQIGTDYILRVLGEATNGGRYDFDVLTAAAAGVPLPASIWYFGGAMAGLSLLMRRRGSQSVP